MSGISLTYQQKGGKSSWEKRRKNPQYYKSLGCIIPNNFNFPKLNNPQFAEFIGIVLGDGGLTNCQLGITLNKTADQEYIQYVADLIKTLFNYTPSISKRNNSNAVIIRVTGVNFVKFLTKCGLFIGNKVKLQVGIPKWISSNPKLSARCVRGLIDTDGCFFINKYEVNHKQYSYRKLAFSNRSKPLLTFVYTTLKHFKMSPIYYQNKQIRLCREEDTVKYITKINSSNQRLLKFFS